MNKRNLKMLLNRFLKFSLGGILLSVFAAAYCSWKQSEQAMINVVIIANILFLAWALLCAFDFRMKHRGIKRYFIFNLSGMAVYCGIAIGFSFFNQAMNFGEEHIVSKAQALLFFIFNCFHYISYDQYTGYLVEIAYSAVLCSAIYLVAIALLPLVVRKHNRSDSKK